MQSVMPGNARLCREFYENCTSAAATAAAHANFALRQDSCESLSGQNIVNIKFEQEHRATFSSLPNSESLQRINSARPSDCMNGTKANTEHFDPDRALRENTSGGADPYACIDSLHATENIKALLEGAFEDEDERPRTSLRTRKASEATVSGLADKLRAIGVSEIEHGKEGEVDGDDGVVQGLRIKLLPHQVDGLAWMADKESGPRKKNGILPRGGILADDMGLGKTIQALALILSNPRLTVDQTENSTSKLPVSVSKGTLVVAPLALIRQWEREIESKVESTVTLRVLVHHGPSRTKRWEDLRTYDVVITTYHILASEHAASSDQDDGLKVGCFGLHWYRVILDEAHTIKNRNAKSTQACYALRAHYRWCLTGTPMQNNLDELQSLINFLQIKPYNHLKSWREQITGPMKNGRGGLALKRLQYFLKAFMKRRTKDILKQEGALISKDKAFQTSENGAALRIVERTVENVVAEFDASERQFYERLEQRAERRLEEMMGGAKTDYIAALVLLLRLRQACNHPQLVGGSLGKDRDALATFAKSSQASRKQKSADHEMDDIAEMIAGLSVVTKQCDVCQIVLRQSEVRVGAFRCADCDEDLASLSYKMVKRNKNLLGETEKAADEVRRTGPTSLAKRQRPCVVDMDDQEMQEEQKQVGIRNRGFAGSNQTAEDVGITGKKDADGAGNWVPSKHADIFYESGALPDSISKGNDEGEDNATNTSSEGDVATTDPMSSTKIRYLMEIVKRECGEHKFIVFSQFTSMLDLIEPFLEKEGFVYTRYDGSMRNDQREASLDRLRGDAKTRLLLCSLKCGSLGLNLTAASRVVILEPFWNPFVEEQAIDRVHRLNQKIDVHVYKMTIANTVEERILALQEKKRTLASAAIEGGRAVGKLSMKDIMQLFRRDAEHDEAHEEVFKELGVRGARTGAPQSPTIRLPLDKSAKRVPPAQRRDGFTHGNGSKEDPIYGRRW